MTFTANDARRLTEEAVALDGAIARAETEVCLEKIKKAAESGSNSCYIDIAFAHRSLIIRRLEAAGFTVKSFSDPRDGDSTVVSW